MAEPVSRDKPIRKGSLLGLVSDHAGDHPAAGLVEPAESSASDDRPSESLQRHRSASPRRAASKNPLLAALGGPDAQREQYAETFLQQQERDLREVLSEVPESASAPQRLDGDDAPGRGAPTPSGFGQESRAVPFAARWPEARERSHDAGFRPDDAWRPLIDPAKVVGGVWKSRYIIIGTTLAGAVLAALIALSTPKLYTSVAELLIDPRDLQVVGNEITAAGGLSTEATLAIVENQVRVLTSGSVLALVVERLGLDQDPEFNGAGSEGLGSYIPNVRELLFSGGEADDGSVRRKSLAIGSLAESLHVERGGRTFVVEIWATTESPEKSALIANTVTEVFLETSGAIQSRTVGRASDELTERLAELRSGVEQAERKVEAFKAQNDIVDAQGRLITDDEIVKLNDQLGMARARTLELQARADSTRDLTVDAVLAGNLPEQMSSPVLTEMRTQYSLLRQEADRISARLGPRHPERVATEEQVAAARQRIEQELRLVASSIQVELRRAVQLEQELASRLAQLKARQADLSEELVTLRELEREAAAKRAVYEAFLLRARETGEQKDINTANVSVISPAMPPLEPSSISRKFSTIFGAIMGFGVGVLFGAGRGTVESLTQGPGPSGGSRRRPAEDATQPQRSGAAGAEASSRMAESDGGHEPQFVGASGADLSPTRHDAFESEVSARNQAQENNSADETADSAEEADMYHQKPQNAWGPQHPLDNQSPYQGQERPAANWPDHPQAGGSVRGYGQYPAAGQHHPYPQHHAASSYGYPQNLPQQVYGQPYAPNGYPAHPQPSAQQNPYGYSSHPGHPQMDPASAMYGQPAHLWQHGQHPAQHFAPAAPYGQMPFDHRHAYEGGAHTDPASGYPDYPRASLHDAPVRHASAAAVTETDSAADANKTAIDEIRESLREFREALRELAENRGRRRFL